MTNEFKILNNLVNADEGNENLCRDALKPLAKYLLGDSNLTLSKAEWVSDRGRIDLILIAEPINTQLSSKLFATDKVAKIYELKAPNKAVFEFNKNSKRFVPSSELISAETQLIDYTYRSINDVINFQMRFGTIDIQAAGIIIGRDKTMFKIKDSESRNVQEDDLNHLKTIALKSRINLLYKNNNLDLFNWDHVLKMIKLHL